MSQNLDQTCRILFDLNGRVVKWVCRGLKEKTDWVGCNVTLGIILHTQLIAGVIIHDIRPLRDAWLTIYSVNQRWCNRRVLRIIFDVVFDFLKCQRVSALVDVENLKSQSLVLRLGFVKEGCLRNFQDNGHDALVYSMLKKECQWRTKENE